MTDKSIGFIEYHVTWEIDVHATDPVDAARRCLMMQKDPTSTATVFDVKEFESKGDAVRVDLSEADPEFVQSLDNAKRITALEDLRSSVEIDPTGSSDDGESYMVIGNVDTSTLRELGFEIPGDEKEEIEEPGLTELKVNIRRILDYNWDDELDDYQRHRDRSHVFHSMVTLRNMVDATKWTADDWANGKAK